MLIKDILGNSVVVVDFFSTAISVGKDSVGEILPEAGWSAGIRNFVPLSRSGNMPLNTSKKNKHFVGSDMFLNRQVLNTETDAGPKPGPILFSSQETITKVSVLEALYRGRVMVIIPREAATNA